MRYWKYHILPFVFLRKTFIKNKYDQYNFASGRADAVLVFDKKHLEVLGNINKHLTNLILTEHPLKYYSNNQELIVQKN